MKINYLNLKNGIENIQSDLKYKINFISYKRIN